MCVEASAFTMMIIMSGFTMMTRVMMSCVFLTVGAVLFVFTMSLVAIMLVVVLVSSMSFMCFFFVMIGVLLAMMGMSFCVGFVTMCVVTMCVVTMMITMIVVSSAHLDPSRREEPDDTDDQKTEHEVRFVSAPPDDRRARRECDRDDREDPFGLVPQQRAQAERAEHSR